MYIAYRAENMLDAHLVKDALEPAGMAAFVSGEYLLGAVGQLPAGDDVPVQVSPRPAREADRVVAGIEAMLAQGRAAPISCRGRGLLPCAVLRRRQPAMRRPVFASSRKFPCKLSSP